MYKYCLGWLVSLFWPYGWLLSPHNFCKHAPVAPTSHLDQPVSVTQDIRGGPIKSSNSDELVMRKHSTQVELDMPILRPAPNVANMPQPAPNVTNMPQPAPNVANMPQPAPNVTNMLNLKPAPNVANPNPSKRTELLESNFIDPTEPNKSLKQVEDASFGSIRVSSNDKIEAHGELLRGLCWNVGNKNEVVTPINNLVGTQKKKPAKSHLLEICTKQKWEPPVFECCKEEGPSHRRTFTFKVNVKVNDPNTDLECFSSPHPKKKAAAEQASEGALWYLKHLGYQ